MAVCSYKPEIELKHDRKFTNHYEVAQNNTDPKEALVKEFAAFRMPKDTDLFLYPDDFLFMTNKR